MKSFPPYWFPSICSLSLYKPPAKNNKSEPAANWLWVRICSVW